MGAKWGDGNINLASNYVFYEHLKETNSSLYNRVNDRLSNMVSANIPEPNSSAITKLKQMATEERKKEQDFINNAFGLNLNLTLDETNTKDFIDCFNAYMQLDKVYDMRKALLLHKSNEEGGQNLKDAYSFFNTYLADSFSRSSTIKKDLADLILYAASEQDAENKVNNYMNQIMPRMVQHALDRLSKAGANKSKGLSKEERVKIQEGLRAINDSINQLGKTRFGAKIVQELGLYNFSKTVAENTKNLYQQRNQVDLYKKVSTAIKDSKATLKSSVNISGGIMLELTTNAGLRAIEKTIKGKYVKTIHTGSTGMKADNIMIVMDKPIPSEQINSILQDLSHSQKSRQSNIDAIEKLEKILGKNNSGFIIYFSEKNHFMNTITKDDKGKVVDKTLTGFTAGTSQSLKNFEPVLSKSQGLPAGVSAGTIIQTIMQTLGYNGQGAAIGHDQKEEIKSWLATLFAYFLFDDVGSIGTSIKGSSLTRLHIMDLNGVYIPLSVILDRFAAALEASIDRGMSSPSAFVEVSISNKNILYDYYKSTTEIPQDAWIRQRETAFNEVKVGIKFLKNVRELISGYLDSIG